MDSIPREVEEQLVGQNVLFKVQLRNSKEYYRSYPYTVNKVCNIPEIVEKYVPQNIGSQILNSDVKLSNILFGSDIAEVTDNGFVTPDLSVVTKENGNEWIVEGSVKRCLDVEFDNCDDVCVGQIKKKKKVNVFEDDDEGLISNSQEIAGGD